MLTNYEALVSSTPNVLANILNQVFLTGMNVGLMGDGNRMIDSPYDEGWLFQNAEAAFFPTDSDDPELLDGLTYSIFLSAGITPENEEMNSEGDTP